MIDPPPQTRPQILTREEVMFFDTDCGGVVHNLAYLRWIETARTRLAALIGLDIRTMAGTMVFAVVLRTEADYLSPALIADEVEVHGELESISGARFWCRFTVRRPADDRLLVRARQHLALVKMPAGRPMRLPESWAAKYAHLKSVRPAPPQL